MAGPRHPHSDAGPRPTESRLQRCHSNNLDGRGHYHQFVRPFMHRHPRVAWTATYRWGNAMSGGMRRPAGLAIAFAAAVAGAALTMAAAPARAEIAALVIGIDRYTYINPLQGAVNDARDIADALEGAGRQETTSLRRRRCRAQPHHPGLAGAGGRNRARLDAGPDLRRSRSPATGTCTRQRGGRKGRVPRAGRFRPAGTGHRPAPDRRRDRRAAKGGGAPPGDLHFRFVPFRHHDPRLRRPRRHAGHAGGEDRRQAGRRHRRRRPAAAHPSRPSGGSGGTAQRHLLRRGRRP